MRWLARLLEAIADEVVNAIAIVAELFEDGEDGSDQAEAWEPDGDEETRQYHEAWTEAVDNEVIARVPQREYDFIWWAQELAARS
jgi:hypothetical protein